MVPRDDNPDYQGQPHIPFENTTDHTSTNTGEIRDYIAQCMWDDYQRILSERGMLQSEERVFNEGEDEFDEVEDNEDNEDEE